MLSKYFCTSFLLFSSLSATLWAQSDGATYTIKNQYNGLVLDDTGFGTAPGTLVQQWTPKNDGSTNQNWTFTPVNSASSCTVPISAVNTASNTNVVGNGTPGSCTESAFNQAIAAGEVITFRCGPSPYTLTLTSSKTITQDTVIDGGNLVTLDGGGQVRHLVINTRNFLATSPTLTVQNITLANGHGTDNPDPGTPRGGGAIYRNGGILPKICKAGNKARKESITDAKDNSFPSNVFRYLSSRQYEC